MNPYPVIILAGGLATRLHPITEKIPKALVEVGGRPFIDHQLRLLRARGIRRAIVCAWYRGEMIREHVGDGSAFGLEARFVFDGEKALGTGGAVRRALPLVDGPFFVLYGDSYLPCNYLKIQEYFEAHSGPALMTVFRNRGQWDASNVEVRAGHVTRYDKQAPAGELQFIDYGLGVFRPEAFSGLGVFRPEAFSGLADDRPADLAGIYRGLVGSGSLLAYEVDRRFYEIGSFEGLRELSDLLTRDPDQFLEKDAP